MSAESDRHELMMQIAHLCPEWSSERVETAALFSVSEPDDGLADEKVLRRHIAIFDSVEPILRTIVIVPVTFHVTYVDGHVEKMAVTPRESDAGYFGAGSFVWTGDTSLDVKSTDGPFWRAMQEALATNTPSIEWEE